MLAIAVPVGAIAGSGDYTDDPPDHDDGTPFFGEAKVVGSLKPLAEVRVKAQIRGTQLSVVVPTNEDGQFRIRGLGPGVGDAAVDFSCTKDGYKQAGVMRRMIGSGPNAPVEVECLLERN